MKIIERTLFVSVFLFSLGVTGAAQVCQRNVEAAGGFSYCIPVGWTTESGENQRYKQVFAPRGQTFTPNMNFKDEDTQWPLSEYVAVSKKNILANYAKFGATSIKLVSETPIVSSSGISAIRVAFSTEYKGLQIRTLQYYFSAKSGLKLILTGTILEADKDRFDPIFDAAFKSIQLN